MEFLTFNIYFYYMRLFRVFFIALLLQGVLNVGYALPDVTEQKAGFEVDVGEEWTGCDSFIFKALKGVYLHELRIDTGKACSDSVIFADCEQFKPGEDRETWESSQSALYVDLQMPKDYPKQHFRAKAETFSKKSVKAVIYYTRHRKKWVRA